MKGVAFIVGTSVTATVLYRANAFVAPVGCTRLAGSLGACSRHVVRERNACNLNFISAPLDRSALSCTQKTVTKRRRNELHLLKAQMTEEEMAVDQALIARVAREVEEASGVDLEQLINPAKVVNLERELVKLRAALEVTTGEQRGAIEQEIEKKESTLFVEKRSVMRGWLKNLFVGQAVITTILGGLMAYDAVPFFPHVDLSVRVLGFWFVWLFTVPSLRARKPGAEEKEALNIAFLATPVVSFAMPFITKDPVPIYWVNIAVLAACYGYAFILWNPDGSGLETSENKPRWLKFLYKALDFGSGQERGARGSARDAGDQKDGQKDIGGDE